MLPRVLYATLTAIALSTPVYPVVAQSYPAKVVNIITSEPGGGNDFIARLIAPGLSAGLGQQVVVNSRGNSPEVVSKAPPDGYTILVLASTLWLTPLMRDTPAWEIQDFAPVVLAARAPNVLVVHPSLPVKTTKELIALAKARSGELNYSTGSHGSSAHLSAALFSSMTGVTLTRVNYRGNGPAIAGLVTGEVQLMFPPAGGASPHIKSGRLKALAVATLEPSALLPRLPTVAATLPGFESVTDCGLTVPSGTPAAIISRLNQETVKVLRRPEVQERLLNASFEVVANSPDEFAAKIKSETARLGKVIKDAGIKG